MSSICPAAPNTQTVHRYAAGVKGVLPSLLRAAERAPGVDSASLEVQRAIAAGMVSRASLALRRALDLSLKPLGTTFARYHVLSVLNQSEEGQLPLAAIADQLCVHPATITGIVTRLEQDGLVVRRQLDGDRRTQYASITAAGHELYSRAHQRMTGIENGMPGVSVDALRQLNELLDAVIDASSKVWDDVTEQHELAKLSDRKAAAEARALPPHEDDVSG